MSMPTVFQCFIGHLSVPMSAYVCPLLSFPSSPPRPSFPSVYYLSIYLKHHINIYHTIYTSTLSMFQKALQNRSRAMRSPSDLCPLCQQFSKEYHKVIYIAQIQSLSQVRPCWACCTMALCHNLPLVTF